MRSRRTLDAISAHARSLEPERPGETLCKMHADVCAQRQLAIREQKMRAFVVRHSVLRIHAVVVFAMLFLVAALFRHFPVLGVVEIISAITAVAGLVIGASTYSIGKALGSVPTRNDAWSPSKKLSTLDDPPRAQGRHR